MSIKHTSITRRIFGGTALAAMMMAGGSAYADGHEPMRIALVVKALGIGFFEAAHEGAMEAAEELGDVEIIYTGPTSTTAEGQIEVINSLIAQGVDAIVISANDPDAVVPALQRAMQRGITVLSFDSGVAEEGRMLHLAPSSDALIGRTIIQLAADHLPDGGQVALLSATATSTNQNTWIAEMNAVMGDYPDIEVVATVYGDDLADRSYREAVGLMQTYPDLDAIIAPTSVGIVAAAQAVVDQGMVGQVNVTGLGLPSEMAGAIESGASQSFAIWNPIDLGYAATMLAHELTANGAVAEEGAVIPMGRMGEVELDATNTGPMANPFTYDASNIEQFREVF
ncbi:rhamnose ABC transporter substrate-binding protein [Rhodobacteraceae bacterium M385]|nr:rhamnose ABC transporter substrate-binding protein [Rhodobacteraceae bacterium M385]